MPRLGFTVACLVAYTLVSGGLTTASAVTYVSVAPPELRGLVTALMSASSMILGGAVGPVLFGLVNDLLKPALGDGLLRYHSCFRRR